MNNRGLTLCIICACSAAIAACSSALQNSPTAPLPSGASGSSWLNSQASGRGGAFTTQGRLYVTDNGNNDVALFKNGTWQSLGTISNGIIGPQGDWVDENGNLYVANAALGPGTGVTEYDAAGNLVFTYSAGVEHPADVTVDRSGNVYEADYAGDVNEYVQGSNMIAATCSLASGDFAKGIAVNERGGVFVTFYNEARKRGGIIAFRHGLAGGSHACAHALLPVKLVGPVGIIFDKKGDLVVCDSGSAAVDIIAPPFTRVTGTLGSGWGNPQYVTIDKAGTEAYVVDGAGNTQGVYILTYPEGATVAMLGGANGLSAPISAVDSENYVP